MIIIQGISCSTVILWLSDSRLSRFSVFLYFSHLSHETMSIKQCRQGKINQWIMETGSKLFLLSRAQISCLWILFFLFDTGFWLGFGLLFISSILFIQLQTPTKNWILANEVDYFARDTTSLILDRGCDPPWSSVRLRLFTLQTCSINAWMSDKIQKGLRN